MSLLENSGNFLRAESIGTSADIMPIETLNEIYITNRKTELQSFTIEECRRKLVELLSTDLCDYRD